MMEENSCKSIHVLV